MSRDVVIAMGPVSLAILALLVGRWTETLRLWTRPRDLAYVVATLLFLGASPVIAAFAVDSEPPAWLFAIQCFGVVWGMMLVVAPLVVDVEKALATDIGEGPALVLFLGVGLAGLLAAFVYLVIAADAPWWLWLAVIVAAVAKTEVRLRYGPVLRPLVSRIPSHTSR